MSYVQAILLALLQALTEFLPVSSSGHLVLAQQFMGGVGDDEFLYDVLLHLATAVAILAYFRRDVRALLRGVVRPGPPGRGGFADGQERRLVGLLVLASLPTAVLGLAIDRYLMALVTRADVVGVMLIVTGTLLWLARGRTPRRGSSAMRAGDALLIGTVQGLAVLPGLSRSGATITAGILRGLDRDLAVRFSLLISVPAIAGAALLSGLRALNGPSPAWGPVLVGMAVAAVAGYGAIAVILWMVRRDRFHWFALYLWPLGGFAVLWYHFA